MVHFNTSLRPRAHGARRAHPHRLKAALAALAVAAVGLGTGVVLLPQDKADAVEYTNGTSTGMSTSKVTSTPSGLDVTISGAALVSQADAPNNRYEEWPGLVYAGMSPDQGDIQGVAVGLGNTATSTWGFNQSWNYDQRFHPVTTTTITFEHPVKDPVITMSDVTNQAYHTPTQGGPKDGQAAVAEQVAFQSASNGATSVPFSVELMSSFSSGYEVQGGKTVTPSLVNGQIPYESTPSRYCVGSYQGSNDPVLSAFYDKAFQPGGFLAGQTNNLSYGDGLCGQMKVNTNGAYVTSVTFNINQSWISIAGGQKWDGMGWVAHSINVMTQDEVSGSTTPASYGAATHTVSDLRIGSDIAPAYTTTNVTSPKAGNASNSSDSGYVADSELVRAALTNRSTGTYQVTVPYTNVSKTAYLNGWIDFNNNGTWDAGESATSIATIGAGASGTATLTFQIPAAGLTATPSGQKGLAVRLRLAYDKADVSSSTGFAASGEVEDHYFKVEQAKDDLLVTKTAQVVGGGDAVVGSKIQYTITIANQSTQYPATGVTFVDTLPTGQVYDSTAPGTTAGITENPVGTLNWGPQTIGAGGTATIVYTVTATTAGTQKNTVVVDTPAGCVTTGSDTDCEGDTTVDVDHAGGLTLTKERKAPAGTSALTLGQQVTYRLTVTNTSDETIDNIVVADPMVEALGQTCTLGTTTLTANASTWCEVTYTVTQADIDARHVHNDATADGTWPDDTPVPQADAEKDDDTTAADGALVIAKSSVITDSEGTVKNAAAEGDTITYAITATNTSGFTMTDVSLDDELLGGLGTATAPCTVNNAAVSFPLASLAPSAVITCEGTYTVTAVDVTAGHVYNIATGEANLPPDPDDPDTPIPADVTPGENDVPAGGLEIVKTASRASAKLGEAIEYTITVTNSTNFPMANVHVSDSMLDAAGVKLACVGGNDRDLAAHSAFTCTGSYTVAQADIDARQVPNTATADGEWAPPPAGTPDDEGWPTGDVPSVEDSVVVPAAPDVAGGLVIEKTSTITDSEGTEKTVAAEGDTIAYAITATNTSGYTMTDVSLDDELLGGLGTTSAPCTLKGAKVTFPLATLAPGAVISCEGTFTVTAADAAAGHVYNVATGEATLPPDPSDPDTPIPADVTPGENDVPVGGLEIVKTATPSVTPPGAGDTIDYSITVSNVSNFPMTHVTVTDSLLDAAGVTLTCEGGNDRDLAAHASFTCAATYTVTQSDVDLGRALNTATSKGEWAPKPADTPDTAWPDGDVPPAADTVVTPTEVDPGDGLVIVKDALIDGGTKTVADEGDTITYLIRATNTSGLTMSNVTLTDEMLGELGVPAAPCTVGGVEVSFPLATLAPNAAIECEGSYTVTSADVTAGHVYNIATGEANLPPDPDDPDTPVPADVTPGTSDVPAGGLVVVKTAAPSVALPGVGDTIDYTITVTNASNFPMERVTITDAMLNAASVRMTCEGGNDRDLAAHASFECTATYTVTQADVDARQAVNTAVGTGEWGPKPDDTPASEWPSGDVPSDSDTVTTPTQDVPGDGLVIRKTSEITDSEGTVKPTAAEGDTITYAITATNTSGFTMTDVSLDDELLGGLGTATAPCTVNNAAVTFPLASLAPSAVITCEGTYTVTAVDVTAGHVYNIATGEANLPPDPDDPDTPIPADVTPGENDLPVGGLEIVKEATPSAAMPGVDGTIAYTITVTNPTNFPMEHVTVTDAMLETAGVAVACEGGNDRGLAAHASFQCIATYTVTQADVDAREVVNTATADGEWAPRPQDEPDTAWPTGDVPTAEDSTVTPTAPSTGGGLVIEKTSIITDSEGAVRDVASEGDTIAYAITATNTSGYTMTDVSLDDELLGGLGTTTAPCTLNGAQVTFPLGTLAPDAVITCEGTYTVTAADAAAGHVYNVATGEATLPPDPSDPDTPIPADVTPGENDVPVGGLEVVKTATPATAGLGDTIDYTITVTNVSNFPMVNVAVTDAMLDAAGVTLTCEGGNGRDLAAHASFDCTASYGVTQADVDRSRVLNTAIADGEWAPKPADVPDTAWPTGDVPSAGDFVVTPTSVELGDGLVIVKDALINDGTKTVADEGDTITYLIRATNTSGLTMLKVTLTDEMLGELGVSDAPCSVGGVEISFPLATLAPNAAIECVGSYTVTAADVAAGHVYNLATGTAELPPDPDNPDVPVPADVDPGTSDVPAGGLVVVKTAVPSVVTPGVGDTIDYTVTVTNSSNFPMEHVTVTDAMLDAAGVTLTCEGGNDRDLAAHASYVCTATYTVTQADVDARQVVNVAVGGGEWGPKPDDTPASEWPSGDVPSDTDTVTTPTEDVPGDGLVIVKSAVITDTEGTVKPTAAEGDTITYAITATNTSGFTMTDVTLSDDMLGGLGTASAPCTVDGAEVTFPLASLAPNAVITCEGTYTVTADDVTAGHVYNIATGEANLPPDPDDPDTPIPADVTPGESDVPAGGLEVVKEATPSVAMPGVGDTIAYTITVTNTSNFPMVDVTVSDPMLSAAGVALACEGGNPRDLAAHTSFQCTATYTVTQADVDARRAINTAAADGSWGPKPDDVLDTAWPDGDVPPAADTVITPTEDVPGDGLVITKDALINGGTKTAALEGDTITYLIRATNTSGFTMTDVTLTDEMLGELGTASAPCTLDGAEVTFPLASLAPNGVIECEGTYTVTAHDVTAGHVYNIATGEANLPPDPDDPDTPVPAEVDPGTSDVPAGGLEVVKEATPTNATPGVGDTIAYTITVTNTSIFPMVNVTVSDPMLEAAGVQVTCAGGNPRDLDAHESFQCLATYTVTQADVDARQAVNTATADGEWGPKPDDTPASEWPTGDVPTGSDTVVTPTIDVPGDGLVIRKDALINDGAKSTAGVGDTVSYTITATNTSGFTMTDVTLRDDMIGGLGVPAAPCTVDGQNVTFPLATLAPNGVIACQGSYTVTAVDVAAGHVLNIATGSANLPPDPDNPDIPVPADVTPGESDVPAGGLEVIKTASTGDTKPGVGDTIAYTITVKNTSNFPMTNVSVADSLLDAAGVTLDCQGGNGRDLAAHASYLCTARYTVTQGDVDAGRVLNTATAGGEWAPRPDDVPDTAWPTGPVPPAADTVITPTDVVPGDGLVITKDAVVNGGSKAKAEEGDTITFLITARNTTNKTMKQVHVIDAMLEKAGITLTCTPGNPVDSLAPGATITCTADYVATKADVAAGTVYNIATGSAVLPDTDGNGDTPATVTPDDTDTPTVPSIAELVVTKTADMDRANPGSTLTYTIAVRNYSDSVWAHAVRVSDTLPAALEFVSAGQNGYYNAATRTVTWNLGDIAPGQVAKVTVKATVSSSLTAGAKVINVASVTTATGCVSTGGAECTASSVLDSAARLPITGAEVAAWAGMAAALFTAGGVLLIWRRRTTKEARQR